MTYSPEAEAALKWADRNAAGATVTFDPYVVALAQVVREQHDEIAALRTALDLDTEDAAAFTQITTLLRKAQDRITALEQALEPFASAGGLAVAGNLSLNEPIDGPQGVGRYRIIAEPIYQNLMRAMDAAQRAVDE